MWFNIFNPWTWMSVIKPQVEQDLPEDPQPDEPETLDVETADE